MKFLRAADLNPSVFPLIFPSHLRNTLKMLCFYDCSVCLPDVSQRLPEIWKLSASCWANWTLNGEGKARCDSTHPACRSWYWSLHWLCWMLISLGGTEHARDPDVGQAALWCRAIIYLFPSLLPLCFQGPFPGPGVKCMFWPYWLLQSAASVAEPSQFSTAWPPAPCRREGRAPQKEWQQKEISNVSRGHGGNRKGGSVKEGRKSHPVPPRDDISGNSTDWLILIWNSSWQFSVLEY